MNTIPEVNIFPILRYFCCPLDGLSTILAFWRQLAWLLINNQLEIRLADVVVRLNVEHTALRALSHVSEYRNRKWVCTTKKRYQQYTCSVHGCQTKVRTYCSCTPGRWLCTHYHVQHVLNVFFFHPGKARELI